MCWCAKNGACRYIILEDMYTSDRKEKKIPLTGHIMALKRTLSLCASILRDNFLSTEKHISEKYKLRHKNSSRQSIEINPRTQLTFGATIQVQGNHTQRKYCFQYILINGYDVVKRKPSITCNVSILDVEPTIKRLSQARNYGIIS